MKGSSEKKIMSSSEIDNITEEVRRREKTRNTEKTRHASKSKDMLASIKGRLIRIETSMQEMGEQLDESTITSKGKRQKTL